VIVFDEIKHPQQVWVMNIVWPVTAKDRAAPAFYFVSAFFAASSMTAATVDGSSSIDIWQVATVVVAAHIFFAAEASIAGGSIRSFVETIAHVDFVFQAATVSFSSNIGP
jgi:hypothetical protein